MRLRTELLIFGFVAIILGSILALPLLDSTLKSNTKTTISIGENLGSDVIYAYFSTVPIDNNNAVLWQTITGSSEIGTKTTFYYFILNVTNTFNATINIDRFEVYAAKYMNITNLHPGLSALIENPFLRHVTDITTDVHSASDTSNVWSPHQSRLIAISGINGIREINNNLENGTFYLGAEVYGTPLHSNGPTMLGGSSKQVEVQNVGNQYIYSALPKNQTISIAPYQGLDVYLNRGD